MKIFSNENFSNYGTRCAVRKIYEHVRRTKVVLETLTALGIISLLTTVKLTFLTIKAV